MQELYIRHEKDPAKAWRVWPQQETIPPGSISEAQPYIFELRDPSDPLSADLFIDDQPLDALRPTKYGSAIWRWAPGFHAGSVEAVLKIAGQSPRHFEIITDPDMDKLTRNDFNTMVAEILQDTFALFSLSGFRMGIAKQQETKPPPIARLEFIRSRIEVIEKSIRLISRNPRRALHAKEEILPYYLANRAMGPEIIKSFRMGRVAKEQNLPSRLPEILKGYLPKRIIRRTQKDSFDIPEHRQIKASLISWSEWLYRISDLLNSYSKNSADHETSSVRALWSGRTRTLANRLSDLCRLPFFSEVSESVPRLEVSLLFKRDMAYRKFFKVAHEMKFGLASVFGDFLDMPIARTFDLYELWCFLRLLRATEAEFGRDDIEACQLFQHTKQGEVTISSTAKPVRISAGIALCFQREFREFWLDDKSRGSFSRPMKPDIVLETETESAGENVHLIVLDAKYRIGQGLADALNSIHTYRDALVRESERGNIEGIVTAAYLLTPYIPQLNSGYRDTDLPGRLFHPEYRHNFRFGAVTLRPGMDITEIRVALREILDDAAGRES